MNLLGITQFFFKFLCHQIPERCPQIAGELFPVCWRCSGFFFAFALSFILFLFCRKRMPLHWSILLLLFGAPFWLDGWAGVFHLWHSPGYIRCITGVLAGGVIWPVTQAYARELWGEKTTSVYSRRESVTALIKIAAVITFSLLFWHYAETGGDTLLAIACITTLAGAGATFWILSRMAICGISYIVKKHSKS